MIELVATSDMRGYFNSWQEAGIELSQGTTDKRSESHQLRSPTNSPRLHLTAPTVEASTSSLSPYHSSDANEVSSARYEELLKEHARLIAQKFQGDFSRRNELELEMIGWALDSMETATDRAAVAELKDYVNRHEKLEQQISALLRAVR